MIIEENNQLMLRPLERTDLHFVPQPEQQRKDHALLVRRTLRNVL